MLTLFCTFLLPKVLLFLFGLDFFGWKNPKPQQRGLSQNQNKLTTLHKVYYDTKGIDIYMSWKFYESYTK